MADLTETRVPVYIDFDNIVISQYDALHGRGAFMKDKARNAAGTTAEKLTATTADIGAVLDFASSFGAVAISRAYADWAAAANNRYKKQLVDLAVDLVQLFNTSGTKNGADIRLAIDVVEDLFRLSDISHIVIVAGDSDYIPLAQRARRLGRTVIGIGVRSSTSEAFKKACDDFSYYDELAGVVAEPIAVVETIKPSPADPRERARSLLTRALRVTPAGDDGWVAASQLKQQMKRLDAEFDDKKIGFKSFTDFVKAEKSIAELQEDGLARRVRLRDRG